MNGLWTPTTQKNRLTTRQMNKLKSLISSVVVATDSRAYANYSEHFDGSVKEAEDAQVASVTALNKYLESLLEKK